MAENKLDPQTAENDFNTFVDMMALDVDPDHMNMDDQDSFMKVKRRVIKALENGSLIINDDGEAVYTPQNKKSKHQEPVTFHERTGASLFASDKRKKNEEVAKMFAIMGEMCHLHPNKLSGLVGIDTKVCEALFVLLMD